MVLSTTTLSFSISIFSLTSEKSPLGILSPISAGLLITKPARPTTVLQKQHSESQAKSLGHPFSCLKGVTQEVGSPVVQQEILIFFKRCISIVISLIFQALKCKQTLPWLRVHHN